ncbi:MAG: hypothetical protein ACYTF7_09460 [Planctomycetota bacterium]|jgi:hypothetical protein
MMRGESRAVAMSVMISVCGSARAQSHLATIAPIISTDDGGSATYRAQQGLVSLPDGGFLASKGSCLFHTPICGVARYDSTFSFVTEQLYTNGNCHLGDLTIGPGDTAYVPSSNYSPFGGGPEPLSLMVLDTSSLGVITEISLDHLHTAYAYDDLAGVDYIEGGLAFITYRDGADPVNPRVIFTDTAGNEPVPPVVYELNSRLANGIEIYGNRMYLTRDATSTTGTLHVYDLDTLVAGATANEPLLTYTYDIGADCLFGSNHSEGLNFRWGATGPELWISASCGQEIRQIELPELPEYVSWTGVGSSTGHATSDWSDFYFGWNGQPTSQIDALVEMIGSGSIAVDSNAVARDVTIDAISPELAGHVAISSGAILQAHDVTMNGHASLAISSGAVQANDLTLASNTTLMITSAISSVVDLTGSAALAGMLSLANGVDDGTCLSVSLIQATGGILGSFGTVQLPPPPAGKVNAIAYTPTSVEYVETIPHDLNLDLMVDGSDLGLFLANWGNTGTTDFNDDGVTNGSDLGLLLARWGVCE